MHASDCADQTGMAAVDQEKVSVVGTVIDIHWVAILSSINAPVITKVRDER